ncbi:MAG: alpha-2-macroglobulin family protein [Thalassovita sp.]
MRRAIIALAALVLSVGPSFAADEVPERRIIMTRDVDFYGSDLQALFDTTYQACETACLTQSQCKAFTFNTRSNACFPKSQVTERIDYEGADSAIIVDTPTSLINAASQRLRDLPFLRKNDTSAARQQALKVGWTHPAGQYTVDSMLQSAGRARTAENWVTAMRWMGGAVAQSDQADHWLDYAIFSLNASKLESGNQSKYRRRAISAAINTYLRTDNPALSASALHTMAQAMEDSGRGRDMIAPLRLASDKQPNWPELAEAVDDAVGKYGFRITDNQIESNSVTPRFCAEFSEELDSEAVDYTPYVKMPSTGLAVVASGNKLCVEGLQHGERYNFTYREGLPAANGEALIKDVTLTQYVQDRDPLVRFTGRAYVLPKSADAALPIETVNVDRIDLVLRQVSDRNLLRAIQNNYFARPLSYWERDDFADNIAEEVWRGEGDIQNTLNQDVTTRLPMGDIIADLPAGIYALSAQFQGADPYDDPDHTQWFVLSDLGVTTLSGTDGLHVFVRSLATADPMADATATLISRSNRVLGKIEFDADGHAVFAAGLTKGEGPSEPAMVLVERGQDDMTFLSLTDPAFDLSDRGVEGRPPSPAIDVFMTTERGAYRAGETVHVTALVRDGVSTAIQQLPVTAILTRPDGVEYARHVSTRDASGGHIFAMPLGSTVPRGTWRLDLKADPEAPALASQKFLVEDFLPERIDFSLSLPGGPFRPGDAPTLTVQADYLFGAPAADLPVGGTVVLAQASAVEGFAGYTFGRHDERFSPISEYWDADKTDASGLSRTPISLPVAEQADRPLEARILVSVSEGSGRPVERRLTQALAPEKPVIGIKKMFGDVVAEGTEARFQVIALDSNLQLSDMPVTWTLNRVSTRYQWYQQWGNWDWEAIRSRKAVARGDAMLGDGPVEINAPVEWGNYELVVEYEGQTYVSASTDFYAGWYAPADTSSTPDTLELALDKPAYRSGDTAQLRLVPRYAGQALITVMSNRVIAMKAVNVVEGENVIEVPVTDDWGAGAYVTASVIRPMDVAAGRNPARAMGLSYAKVDPQEKQLQVAMLAPIEANPRGPLTGAVQVDGLTAGDTGYVTIAAVDVGILNLTSFDSPDPSEHYFGQRRLGVEIRDLYGRLIDGMNGAMGQVRSGGDATSQDRFDSPPPTEELVAYFSGPIKVGPDGTAPFSFDLPAFNGTVRLMAVAWSETGVGQAETDVLVRDPVVVTASLPRFLAPGDESRLLLEIVHATGPAGRMGLDVTAQGVTLVDAAPSGVTLDPLGKATLSLPLTAQEVGDHAIRVALTTPDGKLLLKDLTLGVRNNDPEISTTQRFTLAANKVFTLDNNVFAGLRAGSGSAVVTAGPLARLNAPALLASLDRYPYGCTEQVTSQALPLLYMGQVSEALGIGGRDRIQKRVSQAIEKVLTRQATNGAFGLWQPESGDMWLNAYVTDFLSRARAEGYDVPDLAFRMAMDNLRNGVNYAPDFDQGGGELAFALLVLAREGAASMGDLRYYADVKGDAFTTPLAAAQLGAALAQYGDQSRADAMFARAARMINTAKGSEKNLWRADYGTRLRDNAGVLALAVEAGSNAVDRQRLAQQISVIERGFSTQEAAWSLMAAKALVQDPSITGLTLNGAELDGPFVRTFEEKMSQHPLAIRNVADGPTEITLTTTGVPEGATLEGGYGYRIERGYYTPEGEPVSPETVSAGTRLVVVLEVFPFEKGGARLMVNDPLPAGFEIDNPNLLRQGDVRALDWLKPAYAEHSEFRSDRFLAAVSQRTSRNFQLAYMVRAVSPGVFHHPAATVEDMYRPQYRAQTASGSVRVTE